jgi:hypothetical protein
MQQLQQEQSAGRLMRPVLRLQALLVDYDFEFAELLTGVIAGLWGIWLMMPQWHTFASTPTFKALIDVGLPEWFWGGFIGTIGLIQLVGLLWNYYRIRRAATFAACLVWIFLSAMFISANIASTGTIIYPALSFTAAWAYWRMGLVA